MKAIFLHLRKFFNSLPQKYGGKTEISQWDYNVKEIYKRISFTFDIHNVPAFGKAAKAYIYTYPVNISLNSSLSKIKEFVKVVYKIYREILDFVNFKLVLEKIPSSLFIFLKHGYYITFILVVYSDDTRVFINKLSLENEKFKLIHIRPKYFFKLILTALRFFKCREIFKDILDSYLLLFPIARCVPEKLYEKEKHLIEYFENLLPFLRITSKRLLKKLNLGDEGVEFLLMNVNLKKYVQFRESSDRNFSLYDFYKEKKIPISMYFKSFSYSGNEKLKKMSFENRIKDKADESFIKSAVKELPSFFKYYKIYELVTLLDKIETHYNTSKYLILSKFLLNLYSYASEAMIVVLSPDNLTISNEKWENIWEKIISLQYVADSSVGYFLNPTMIKVVWRRLYSVRYYGIIPVSDTVKTILDRLNDNVKAESILGDDICKFEYRKIKKLVELHVAIKDFLKKLREVQTFIDEKGYTFYFEFLKEKLSSVNLNKLTDSKLLNIVNELLTIKKLQEL